MRFLETIGLSFLILVFCGCPSPGTVTRDADTYVAEILAGLARESEAADALMLAAESALEAHDSELCAVYAGPALLIEAKARPQAYRALWLAGIVYPEADGTIPPEGTEQADPGPSGSVESVMSVCLDETAPGVIGEDADAMLRPSEEEVEEEGDEE